MPQQTMVYVVKKATLQVPSKDNPGEHFYCIENLIVEFVDNKEFETVANGALSPVIDLDSDVSNKDQVRIWAFPYFFYKYILWCI